MEYLIYRSTARVPEDSPESRAIFAASRANNEMCDITGFLHREDDFFLQYVEGPGEALDRLWYWLLHDPRHHDLVLLVRQAREARIFKDWSMGYTSRDAISFRDYLREECGKDELTAAAPEEALAFLRDACLVLERNVTF